MRFIRTGNELLAALLGRDRAAAHTSRELQRYCGIASGAQFAFGEEYGDRRMNDRSLIDCADVFGA